MLNNRPTPYIVHYSLIILDNALTAFDYSAFHGSNV